VCVNGRVHRGSSESIVHVVSENCLNKVDIDNSELTRLPLSCIVATQSSRTHTVQCSSQCVSCINDAITGHNVFGLASFNLMELWSSPKPKSNWGLENVVHTMLHHVPKRWLRLALSPGCFATAAWYRDSPSMRLSGRDGDSLICCT